MLADRQGCPDCSLIDGKRGAKEDELVRQSREPRDISGFFPLRSPALFLRPEPQAFIIHPESPLKPARRVASLGHRC
jgi:hypothetical protein